MSDSTELIETEDEEKRGRGRPPHEPTDVTRRQVESLAGFGIPAPDIGRELGISDTTLRKHYRTELDSGVIKANARVAQALFQKATGNGPQCVTAQIFWLKTRAGWKETSVHEHTGKDGNAFVINISADDDRL